MRELPILYKRKEECCGCTACYAICPKEAISMVEDEEGFEYPQIDESETLCCLTQTFFSASYLCLTTKKSQKYNAVVELMRKATQ